MKFSTLVFIALLGLGCVMAEDSPTQEPTHQPTAEPTHESETESTFETEGDAEEEAAAGASLGNDAENLLNEIIMADDTLSGIMLADDPLNKLGPILVDVYKESVGESAAAQAGSTAASLVHEDGTVSIDAVAVGVGSDLQAMIDELTPLGFKVAATFKHIASGTIPAAALGDMCECDTFLFAMPVLEIAEAGSVTSEGVKAMEADKVLKELGFKGDGVTVGVLSDSFNRRRGAAADIASGDLPPASRINVLQELPSTSFGIDEGRAMMQLIFDVAPGVDLAFHTAFGGQAVFAEGIRRLAAEAGCNVIVDDVFNLFEPAFQDGIIAQAVDEAREKHGVTYFASAGNYGRQSYEYPFVDSGITVTNSTLVFHDFAFGSELPRSATIGETIYLPNSFRVTIILQWDESFASASPDSEGSSSDLLLGLFDPVARKYAAVSNVANTGRDPIEIIQINVRSYLAGNGINNVPGYNFQIVVARDKMLGEKPSLLKVTIIDSIGSRFIKHPTNSGSGYGHRAASGSAAVGAAFALATPPYGVDPAIIEPFSSANGVPILFDKNGTRLAEPEIRRQPKFTGPDGTSTTFFGSDNLFFGTSAAAPHVAGVAALMLEANPKLGPRKIHGILEKTASNMSDPSIPGLEKGFDFRTGHGFVNASAAVEAVLPVGVGRKRVLRAESESIHA